jgi:hypothetical protein
MTKIIISVAMLQIVINLLVLLSIISSTMLPFWFWYLPYVSVGIGLTLLGYVLGAFWCLRKIK